MSGAGKKFVYRFLDEDDLNSSIIGRHVHVLWPDNGIWYRAIVKRFNPTTLSAYLLYTETDEEEKDANVKEMIDEKGIAFREPRPSNYECGDNEVEAPTAVYKPQEGDSDTDYSDTDDSIPDAGQLEEDDSDFALDSDADDGHKVKRAKLDDDSIPGVMSKEDVDEYVFESKNNYKQAATKLQQRAKAEKQARKRAMSAAAAAAASRKPKYSMSAAKKDDTEVRMKVKGVFSEALNIARDELKKSGEGDFGANVNRIAGEIESSLYKFYECSKDGMNKEYKTKVQTLRFNLKDPHNPELRAHVLREEITPDRLVRMTAAELASKELAEYRKQKEQEALKMSVIDAEAAAKFSTAAALDARDKLGVPASVAAEKLLSARDDDQPGSKPNNAAGLVPRRLSGASEMAGEHSQQLTASDLKKSTEAERRDSMQMESSLDKQTNINWASLKAQTATAAQEPTGPGSTSLAADLSFLPSLNESGPIGNQLGGADGDHNFNNNQQAPEQTYDDYIEAPFGNFHWLFQTHTAQESIPWSAQIVVPGGGSFHMSGQPLSGMYNLSTLCGPGDLIIRGRVSLEKLEMFLNDLQLSKHRTACIALLHLPESASPADKESFDTLVEQYREKQRAGVAHGTSGAEVYLLPQCHLATEILDAVKANVRGQTAVMNDFVFTRQHMLAVAIYRRDWQPPPVVHQDIVPPAAVAVQEPPRDMPFPGLPAGLDLSAIDALAKTLLG